VFVSSTEGATDGTRVAGAQVSLNRSSGMGNWYDSPIETVTCDGQGCFEFSSVPASGSDGYMLCVNADGYCYRQVFIVVSENLTKNIDLTPVDSSLPYMLYGYVINASSGMLIDNAYVSISGPVSGSGYYQLWDVVHGYYQFWCLPTGDFTVTAAAPHFTSQTVKISVGDDEHNIRHDFILQFNQDNKNPTSPVTDDKPPVARFTQDTYLTLINAPVTFNPSQSNDSDGTIVTYMWDWEGDGVYDANFTNADPVSHVYLEAGTYQPTLKVIDNDGSFDIWHPEQATVVMEKVNTVPEVPLGTIAVAASMIAALVAFVKVPKTRFFKQ
jgi:hypothetical protein